MSSTTSNLELFKYNTTADASTPFSITNALNNNWDKIDTFAGTINTLFNGDLSSATGKTLFSDINTQLGQKLEAEVLLEENGYIKFNNVIIQWLLVTTGTNKEVTTTLPTSYTTIYAVSRTINAYTNNSTDMATFRFVCVQKASLGSLHYHTVSQSTMQNQMFICVGY